MKTLDVFLQKWRIRKTRKYIPANARVLDVGCFDGTLFRLLGSSIRGGVGIDPLADTSLSTESWQLVKGLFPDALPKDSELFDAITMLAVLEHFPEKEAKALSEQFARILRPGGRLIISVPSPAVDTILKILLFLRIIDGMSLEEHHGMKPSVVPTLFLPDQFTLVVSTTFQLGLNNLFVFERTAK